MSHEQSTSAQPSVIREMNTPQNEHAKITVEVHPVDVGQGDCCFVVFKGVKEPDGDGGERGDYVIMIDGGYQLNTPIYWKNLESMLEQLKLLSNRDGEKRCLIDLIVATHADADHYAGIDMVLKEYQFDGYMLCSSTTLKTLIDKKRDITMFKKFSDYSPSNNSSFPPFKLEKIVKFRDPSSTPTMYLMKKISEQNSTEEWHISLDEIEDRTKFKKILNQQYELHYDAAKRSYKVKSQHFKPETITASNRAVPNHSVITVVGNIKEMKDLLVFTGDNKQIDVARVLLELKKEHLEEHRQKRKGFEENQIAVENTPKLEDITAYTKNILKQFSGDKNMILNLNLLQVPHHGSSVIPNAKNSKTVFYDLLSFYHWLPAKNYLISAGNWYRRAGQNNVYQPDKDYGHPHPSTVISIIDSIKRHMSTTQGNLTQIFSTNEKSLPCHDNSKLEETLDQLYHLSRDFRKTFDIHAEAIKKFNKSVDQRDKTTKQSSAELYQSTSNLSLSICKLDCAVSKIDLKASELNLALAKRDEGVSKLDLAFECCDVRAADENSPENEIGDNAPKSMSTSEPNLSRPSVSNSETIANGALAIRGADDNYLPPVSNPEDTSTEASEQRSFSQRGIDFYFLESEDLNGKTTSHFKKHREMREINNQWYQWSKEEKKEIGEILKFKISVDLNS